AAATAWSRQRACRCRSPRGSECPPAWSSRDRDRAGTSPRARSRRLLRNSLVEIFAHLRGDSAAGELAQPDRMDARVLILVVDLRTAFLDRGVGILLELHLVREHGIAVAAHRDRKVAGGLGTGVEMLMEHAVGRREHETVAPFVPLELGVALVPHQS